MKRQPLLRSFGGIGALALAGCLGDDEDEQSPASDEDGHSSKHEGEGERPPNEDRVDEVVPADEAEGCTDPEFDVTVSLPPAVPDDAAVVDAAAAGLTEIGAVESVLSEASITHSEEMEGNDEHVWLADGKDQGELYDEFGGSTGYVKFEGVTYAVETYQAIAC
ncbi:MULTISPECIES: hypothetical protein [Natrialbaceae]|uniref:hypothetical protein n=1 Tax=Natrialbaceae TaxID=1644061 RepID=UPI00207C5D7C|nr:hypothetical protein [Natronococcus sp. CG52]